MDQLVRWTRHGEVGVITIDYPPVNALSTGVPEGIEQAIKALEDEPQVTALLLIGASGTFIAGADIRQLQEIAIGRTEWKSLLPFLMTIENCPKPVVMAIEGTAFGGGLETAMAGHYRVVGPRVQVGQPEVKLGLIPGMAGTQRLPRLTGVEKALDMCWRGEPIGAEEAVQFGIADRVIAGDLRSGAVEFAREIATRPIRRTRERNDKISHVDRRIFDDARGAAQKVKRGQNAPLAAIDAIQAAVESSFEEGCAYEEELFRKCLQSTEAKAMIYAFFSERVAAKIPGISKETPVFAIESAAVVGAGTMGGGIAMNYANAGIPVIVKEATQDALDRGMDTICRNYSSSLKKGRITQEAMNRRLALIRPQLSYSGFEDVDIIAEAVFENLQIKKGIFRELDEIAKPSCILASNTSSLSISEIASATKHPERVVGHHYFSPANVMRLVEVVRGDLTSDAVIATSMALGRKLKKIPVFARDSWGFIGNRMIHAYMREAEFLVEEGASVEDVNDALYEFGMAMGPLAMSDLAGIDVTWRVRDERKIDRKREREPLILDKLYAWGRWGQKTGAGWSKYNDSRERLPDSTVASMAEDAARKAGIKRRDISRREIVDRCILALINEGAKVLEEGVALRASDIDVVYLNGYGFPVWRGGPMFYADTMGLKQVLARIEAFEQQHGSEFWAPASLLRKFATTGKSFAEMN